MIMRLYDWEPLTLGHHAANFFGFRHCGREDKNFQFVTLSQKTTYLEGCQTLKIETPYNISPPCQV